MNFFDMKAYVDAAEAKKKASAKTSDFSLPAVGENDPDEARPKTKTKKKKSAPVIPEGAEAENIIKEDAPDEEDPDEEEEE